MPNDLMRGRQTVVSLTNKSGSGVVAGDVVILSSSTAGAFTTTASASQVADWCGVALETIANDSAGRVCLFGYVPIINLSASAALGDYVYTHTVAKQATPSGTDTLGSFGQVLGTGATPAAILWGRPTQNTASESAPSNAEYVTEAANGSLSSEAVLGTTVITSTAYASRQAAAKAGRLFLPNNSFYLQRDTGAAWTSWGPIFPMTPPVSGNFTWVNQGSASVTTTNGGVVLYAPATSGNNYRIRKKAAPTPPYTITAAFLATAMQVNYTSMGLLFRQSSNGKMHSWNYFTQSGDASGFVSYKMVNETTASGGYDTLYPAMRNLPVVWLRIADNNTNRICSWSGDGVTWFDLHVVSRTDFLTADEVGFYVDSCNATFPAYMTLLSWVES